jgi:hypothetical protein
MFHQIFTTLVLLCSLQKEVVLAENTTSSSSQIHPPLLLPICPFEHRHLKRDVARQKINPTEKAAWFKDTKAKEVISNHRYIYYGTTDKLGRRSGRGFMVNHLDSSFYIGGMCNNMRHYYGIELQPSEHAPGYRAYAYYWNQGIPVLRASIPPHLKKILKRLSNCKQMYYLLANMLGHIPRANCEPFLECKDGTESKETPTDYAAPSVRTAKPHSNELIDGSCITHNTPQEKSVDGFSPKYDNSSLFLLRGKVTGLFGLHLFTLDPEYHPRAKLYSKDTDGRWVPVKFNSENENLNFGLSKNQDYLLEVGISPTKGGSNLDAFGRKKEGGFACLFSEKLTKKLHTMAGNQTFENQAGNSSYKVNLMKGSTDQPGDFNQYDNGTNYFIGILNTGITPYYSPSDDTLTFYYTGGSSNSCGDVNRNGKLTISNSESRDSKPSLSVNEPGKCSYHGSLKISSFNELFHVLEKNKYKMMPAFSQ